MKKQIISARQFTIITCLDSIGTAILIMPATMVQVAKQDAWIPATVGVFLSLLLIKLFVTVGNTTPGLSLVEANEKILGKFFGKIISIAFFIFTFLSAGELLYFIGNFMKSEVMPETPAASFVILFIIIIAYATYLGLEVFARSAEILFPIFLFIFIIFVTFISPQIKIENIQPILEASTGSLLLSTLQFLGTFSFPIVVLLMIFPSSVSEPKSAQKGFYIGILLGGLVLTILIALSIFVLGVMNTSLRTYPSYALAQRISIGNFLQRIEITIVFLWITTIYIRTFIYFYASVKGLGHILNLKEHRPLILPLGMIVIGLSQITHPSIVHSMMYNKKVFLPFAATFALLLPLLLLVVAKMRRISGKEQNNQMKPETNPTGNNTVPK